MYYIALTQLTRGYKMKINDIIVESSLLKTVGRKTIHAKLYKMAYEALERMIEKYPNKTPYFLASEIARMTSNKVDAHELGAMWDERNKSIEENENTVGSFSKEYYKPLKSAQKAAIERALVPEIKMYLGDGYDVMLRTAKDDNRGTAVMLYIKKEGGFSNLVAHKSMGPNGKLVDVFNTESVNEDATAVATVAANIASVPNPNVAHSKPKKGKNGAPQAPQAKNADGTAKNALDIDNSVFGGKTVKR